MCPSGVAASARGVSPNSSTIVSGAPSAARSAASNTHTSARGVPGVLSAAGTEAGRFCPRRAVVTKARVKAPSTCGPAKTTSRGSSPTSSVRTTRGGSAATSTTLTLSERWLTTHTSPSVRAATATGSRPTGTDPRWVRPPAATAKISSRSSGVLTANSRVPSGDNANGRTGPLSKVTKPAAGRVNARSNATTSAPVIDSGVRNITRGFSGRRPVTRPCGQCRDVGRTAQLGQVKRGRWAPCANFWVDPGGRQGSSRADRAHGAAERRRSMAASPRSSRPCTTPPPPAHHERHGPLFWMGAAYLAIGIAQGASPRRWLLVGVCLGLGLLNKHSTLFFGAALIAGLLLSPHDGLLQPWAWIGGLVALHHRAAATCSGNARMAGRRPSCWRTRTATSTNRSRRCSSCSGRSRSSTRSRCRCGSPGSGSSSSIRVPRACVSWAGRSRCCSWPSSPRRPRPTTWRRSTRSPSPAAASSSRRSPGAAVAAGWRQPCWWSSCSGGWSPRPYALPVLPVSALPTYLRAARHARGAAGDPPDGQRAADLRRHARLGGPGRRDRPRLPRAAARPTAPAP